jgi:hypothetical protein
MELGEDGARETTGDRDTDCASGRSLHLMRGGAELEREWVGRWLASYLTPQLGEFLLNGHHGSEVDVLGWSMRPGVAKLEREATLQQPVLVGEASKQAFEGDTLLETLGRDALVSRCVPKEGQQPVPES